MFIKYKVLDSTPNDSDSIHLGPGLESRSFVGTPGESNVGNVVWHLQVQNNGFESPKKTIS